MQHPKYHFHILKVYKNNYFGGYLNERLKTPVSKLIFTVFKSVWYKLKRHEDFVCKVVPVLK
jgi:hypothetical protein